MNETPRGPDLLAATRFVQAGRLTEATALLQRLLRGEPAACRWQHRRGTSVRQVRLHRPDARDARGHRTAAGSACHEGGRDRCRQLAERRDGSDGPINHARSAAQLPRALQRQRPRGRAGWADRAGNPPTPDVLPDGAKFLAGSYSNQAGSRAYKLYVPSTYHGQTLPLVVMLHGCTQSPDDFAAGTRMNVLAEEHGCLVAYPAQAASANISKCWNWFKAEDQQRDGGEPSLIAGITRQIMAEYPVDPQRVYVAGLSAGGAAAAVMAATYPDLYAAVGVHSGLAVGAAKDMPSAFAAMQGGATTTPSQSGRSTAGGRGADGADDRVPWRPGPDGQSAQWRSGHRPGPRRHHRRPAGNGDGAAGPGTPADGAYRRTTHADAAGQAMLEQWVIQGAGHAWSGGSPAGSYTDPQGPDASREMLRFFLEHPHPTAAARSVH